MRSYWITVGPNPVTGVLIRRGKFGHRETQTQREDGHVKREVEIVVVLSQPMNAKGLLSHPRN